MTRPAAVLSLLAALASACAGAPVARGRCSETFDHAEGLLRAGLATYVDQLSRYVTTADPTARTEETEARATREADAWRARHRDPVVKECHAWPEERLVCVLEAGEAAQLGRCGLGELVQSFTDEVVTSFATMPVDGKR